MMTDSTFSPDWISPPGDTIQSLLATRNMSLDDLAIEMDLTSSEIHSLISGRHPIDKYLAEQLENSIGGSLSFWMAREKKYRERLACPEGNENQETISSFIKKLPIADMKALGWLDKFKGLGEVEAVSRFFSDAGGDWRRNGIGLSRAVAFRTSYAFKTNTASVAAWLWQGVVQASEFECAPFSAEGLQACIPQLRALTRQKDPNIFFPALNNLCNRHGVAVVLVRTPKGCQASGAAHFASPEKAIIQLSLRYRSDDHFWFTFFHEIAHLILHKEGLMYVENNESVTSYEEDEANLFSANTLIPEDHADELLGITKEYRSIMRFARRIGISPGIVVGQLQKKGTIRHNQMNYLKARYDWSQCKGLTP